MARLAIVVRVLLVVCLAAGAGWGATYTHTAFTPAADVQNHSVSDPGAVKVSNAIGSGGLERGGYYLKTSGTARVYVFEVQLLLGVPFYGYEVHSDHWLDAEGPATVEIYTAGGTLLGTIIWAAPPPRALGFRLVSPPAYEVGAASLPIEISVAAFGMLDVTKATVDLKALPGTWTVSGSAGTALFTKNTLDSDDAQGVLVVESTTPVSGDALLGTFTLMSTVAPGAAEVIAVESIGMTEGGTEYTFSASAGQLELETVVNPSSMPYRVSTSGRAEFPGNPVILRVEGPSGKGSLTATIRRHDVLPGSGLTLPEQASPVTLTESATDPGVYEGTLVGIETQSMLGMYYIDLDDGSVPAAPISGAGGFALAHTIVYVPDPMLVGPNQKTGVDVPLVVENDPNSSAPILPSDMILRTHILESPAGLEVVDGTASLSVGPQAGSAVANRGWEQLEYRGNPAQLLSSPPVLGSIGLDLASGSATSPSLGHASGPLTLGVDVLLEGPNGLYRDPAVVGLWGGRLDGGWGDVNGDGLINAVDASLVLMHSVGKVDLTAGGSPYAVNAPDQEVDDLLGTGKTVPVKAADRAEVTGNGGAAPITGLDASFILRRAVHAVFELPVELGHFLLWQPVEDQADRLDRPWWAGSLAKRVAGDAELDRTVSLGRVTHQEGSLSVPVLINEVAGVLGGSFELEFDASRVAPVGVTHGELTREYLFANQVEGHRLRVSFAGLTWKDGEGTLAQVQLRPLVEGASVAGDVRLVEVALNEGLTPVRLEGVSPLPRSLALYPNFPNPFNPSTTLRFDLPAAGVVDLSIYNVIGQQVRTLVRGAQDPGHYRLEWDGLDEAGRSVASGTYLARLESETGVLVQKMLMVK